jgi:hypothetical protein
MSAYADENYKYICVWGDSIGAIKDGMGYPPPLLAEDF